jgi:hypothetical protein
MILSLCSSRIFSENRLPLFRIMLQRRTISVGNVTLRRTDDPATSRESDGVRKILLENDAEIMEPLKQFAQTDETGVLDIVQYHNAPILF